MRTIHCLGVLTLSAALAACASAGRTAAWEREDGAAAAVGGIDAVVERATGDELWAQRDDRAKLEGAIAAWEKAVSADPKDGATLTKLARAYYFLSDGFIALEPEAKKAELAAYQKGVDFGERALLVLEPEFEADMKAKKSFEDGIRKISSKGMEAAYWYCTNLGRFASNQGLSERLYYKDKLKTAMERILELDPKFYYGAADRYFGAFYTVLPGFAGKDTDRAARHFASSLEYAPEYLSTKVVQAQFLAKDLDDEDMFRQLLEAVLASPDTDNVDIAPENRAAKRHAKKMLDEIDEIF